MKQIRRYFGHAIALIAAFLLYGTVGTTVAQAQFGDGFKFLEAVEKDEMAKAEKMLANASQTLINTRKSDSGASALHIAIGRKDEEWVRFLLIKGAKPDIADSKGNTPLIIAAQLKFIEGARMLMIVGADVNATNGSGETALIRAVQMRDLPMVRLLMEKGADPDIVDNVAGQSARDYAGLDRRMPALLVALDAKPKSTAAAKP